MLVSANRTRVELVAAETVAGAEAVDLGLHVSLLGFEACELVSALGQRAQVVSDKRAEGAAALGGPDPCGTVDIVGYRDGDVLHIRNGITASQKLWDTGRPLGASRHSRVVTSLIGKGCAGRS